MNFSLGVLCSFGLGGADRCNLNILHALKNVGIPFKMFYTDASVPKRVPGFHPEGWIPPSRQFQFEHLGELHYISHAEDINKFGITLLHTHRSGEDEFLIPSLQSARINFKILETNFYGPTRTRADLRVFVSRAIARNNSIVIPNAIAPPATSLDLRDELNLNGKFVFGKLSRPDNDIYSPISIEAYAKVEDDTTVFLYIGTNPKAIDLANRLGIKSMIFMDPILDFERVSAAYNSIDLFCHSNGCGETFGNTVAEAFMHGVPAISHRGGADRWPQAHRELFGERTDLYLDDRDISAYASLMRKMSVDSEFRGAAAKYLHTIANELYRSDVVASKYIKLYGELS